MDEPFNDKKTSISEFNEAGFQIQRLNSYWVKCGAYSLSGDLVNYKFVLDRIFIELSADAKKKNEQKYFSGINKLNLKIIQSRNRVQLYKALQDKEIFLRCLQEDVGKGSKKTQHYEGIM